MATADGKGPARPSDSRDEHIRGVRLARQRERIVDAALRAVIWAGMVAYLPSVWAGWKAGVWGIIALDTLVYGAVVAVYLHPRTGYAMRAGVLVGCSYLLGLVLSLSLGPDAAGALWLCAAPILSAAFFDLRVTVAILLLTALTVVGVSTASFLEILLWTREADALLVWIVTGGNLIVLSTALSLAVATLIRGLEQAGEEAEGSRAELAAESERLTATNLRLQEEMARREKAESHLRQSEKLQAIGTLAAGIAHDFNNLLVPIMAGAGVLREDAGMTRREREELADGVLVSARSGRDLVNRLLAFSRPSGTARAPLDAALAFGDAARLLRATLPGAVQMELHLREGAGSVILSPAEVHQIILNLGGNAYKAMPDGGTLEITVEPTDAPPIEDPLLPRVPNTQGWVRVRVADTGEGMPEEVRARATEPFFTTRGEGEGSGIGLATVHAIVTSAGGMLTIDSRPGAGTRVEVHLPRATDAVAEAPPPGSPPGKKGKGSHLLVVDDEEVVRQMACRVLERSGYRTTCASNAEEALRELREEGSGIEAVITDMSMPRMSGLALADEVRRMDPHLPLILVSGLLDDELRARARELGIGHLLPKPYSIGDLLRAVEEALDSRGDRPPAEA